MGTPVTELNFRSPQAVIFERRNLFGETIYVVGVTNGVRTVERFLHNHKPWRTRRTAGRHANNLQRDLNTGRINPNSAFESRRSRGAHVEDLTGYVAPAREAINV